MTDETLSEYIDEANLINSQYILSNDTLSNGVAVARCLVGPSEEADFYFLENSTGDVVGVVYDMIYDLHAFVQEEYRDQGICYKALRDVIIPHIKVKRPDKPIKAKATCPAGRYILEKLGFTGDQNGWNYVLVHQVA